MKMIAHTRGYLAALILSLVLSACGYAEWPPRGDMPSDINRRANNNTSFVGASAVKVGRGDTVFALSRRHKVPMQAIIEANNLKAPFVLRIGQRIVLPRGRTHIVQKGDTLSEIADRYSVDTYQVAQINGLRPPFVIHIGQPLTLPGSGTSGVKTVSVSPNSTLTSRSKKAVKSAPQPAPAWSSPPKPASTVTANKSASIPKPVRVPTPPAKSGSGFIWPVKGKVISNFGAKPKGLKNDGVNIRAKRGTPVFAAENGVVAYAGNELRGFGNLLLIKHSGGWITAYAHNERLLVKRGQRLKRGQKIATVGSSGNVTSPQLHFEIRKGKTPRDPRRYLGKA
jgi:murein DD-endopeptidase MepM/ murein hydrolase activator NlpD